MYILGISAFYHDAAAALILDGKIIAAAQEERFSRIRHDESFPINAIKNCLREAHIDIEELDAVVFYEKPFLKFERILETYIAFAPKGIRSFIKAISSWSKKKLFIKKIIRDELKKLTGEKNTTYKILFAEHHLAHAGSAFYPSPFDESAILVIDAVGESASTSIFHATTDGMKSICEQQFPHSVGLLYSAFTYFLGFKVNSGEYKLMGLAPYGDINSEETLRYKKLIVEKLCTIFEDGSIFIHQQYFNYATGLTMANDAKWSDLFGFVKRQETDPILSSHCNLALAIQTITEEIIIKLAGEALKLTGSKNLCLAGGVALNCVANSKLLNEKIFSNIYIQPASGDAGGAIGGALSAYYIYYNNTKQPFEGTDQMKGGYLGPEFSAFELESVLKDLHAKYEWIDNELLFEKVAGYIDDGKVIGWFQGRMEFGPRALGNRSILADPRRIEMHHKLNAQIKFRENFRPFAPSVREDNADEYFDMHTPSPFMLFVSQAKGFAKDSRPANYNDFPIEQKRQFINSPLPAVTHADGSARVQTVTEATNPPFSKLLAAFKKRTGCGVLINTSFNVRGEPIVCTPEDAIRCFMHTNIDILILGNFILNKEEQANIKLSSLPNRINQSD